MEERSLRWGGEDAESPNLSVRVLAESAGGIVATEPGMDTIGAAGVSCDVVEIES